jgi:hypothetical protein
MTANMIKTQMSSTIMKNKKSFDDDCCCYAKTLKTTAQNKKLSNVLFKQKDKRT